MKETKQTINPKIAECPFFKGYERNRKTVITCEGLTESSNIKQVYRARKEGDIQFNTFCAACYKKCELYNAIMEASYAEDI